MQRYLLIVLVCCAWLSPLATASEPEKLVLFNWSEYIAPQLIEAFEQQYGVTVEEVHYETDELKDSLLVATNGGEGIDVMVSTGSSLETYLANGWLHALDAARLPNRVHLHPRWQTDSAISRYAVPYLWGTLGIAYRYDKYPHDVSSWMELFKPRQELKGKIMMINDSREVIGLALKALGYSYNSTDSKQLREAERLLLGQRPYVGHFGYLDLDETSSLVTGDIWMAMVYNGDGITLSEVHDGIRFVVPDEGTNVWVDYLAVMEKSTRKALAYQFINFLHEPGNAAILAKHLNFATPNASAQQFLDDAFLNDTTINPSDDIMERSEMYRNLDPRSVRTRNQLFLKLVR